MGSERSRWKLLPSEVINHVCALLELNRLHPRGNSTNIKGAFFSCACWAGWRCRLPPTFGGLVGLRPSEAPEGGLWHRQQQHAAQDCML